MGGYIARREGGIFVIYEKFLINAEGVNEHKYIQGGRYRVFAALVSHRDVSGAISPAGDLSGLFSFLPRARVCV